jgi:hypothetical protein
LVVYKDSISVMLSFDRRMAHVSAFETPSRRREVKSHLLWRLTGCYNGLNLPSAYKQRQAHRFIIDGRAAVTRR